MAMPKKDLVRNSKLKLIVDRHLLGVPLAQLHREYIAQGEDFMLSLPVFMRLIKKEIDNGR